ncbi:MAG: hypothetical protein ABSE91_04225 [Patescibacteria group bacterium]
MARRKRWALVSVYDKTGIVEFAKALRKRGFSIIASGGTAGKITEAGIPVTDVATLVGGGAILGHRVVTLSREIHAGLLAKATDTKELKKLGISWIDMVVCDFYPLRSAIAKPGATTESVIEDTDIGGPCMVRSGAKGRRIVVCRPQDRQPLIEWLDAGSPPDAPFFRFMHARAEFEVVSYVLASAIFHGDGLFDGILGERVRELAYGENRLQSPAVFYSTGSGDRLGLDCFEQVAGGPPSYNGYTDIDRLLETITHIAASFVRNFGFVPQIAVAVKHGNPCGAAVGMYPTDVLARMVHGDPLAIFGGVVMTNFGLDVHLGEILVTDVLADGKARLLDGIVAPYIDNDAIETMERKSGKCRMFINRWLEGVGANSLNEAPLRRPVRGGYLKQGAYNFVLELDDPEMKCHGPELTLTQKYDMVLAWAIAATSNSNTITLTKNGMLIGNGVGQQDRVGAAKLAISRAARSGHSTKNAVAASDSFFPFKDGPQVLVEAGIAAIFATSGSRADKEVIDYLQDKRVSLRIVPDAIGRGFYRH